ncbi:50S ribosomal protein L5 [Candidatus Collierbacteria bacterium RIFOXYB1_FULL_49_13]|uniref:Large ribosomal subunit protein uL5 n=1 Tax=Candidatus Collierbacteria bacterium RIFOXYB1_FULL_49_13 TaxID=1817728 RepID=A0A1F5FHT3_9BACT|nr:ribosomal protein L5 [uncultured bacterium]OGD79127.1 MAG: 50S ribosomal protein L5 [Candidatus Collierbacteria bacterium RIFOXYB1_FULL_49_13]
MNTLRTHYQDTLRPALQKELGLKNLLAVPRLTKIVVNTSSKELGQDKELLAKTKAWMSEITGQAPKVTKAKKSIAGFNLREGDIIGLTITLRGVRMYDFIQKLIHVVLPRTKDFQGIPRKSFDGRGTYTLGLNEQIIFPEVEYDKIGRIQGLEITICSSSRDGSQGLALMTALGMPFAKEK